MRRRLPAIFLLLVLVLAACAGGSDEGAASFPPAGDTETTSPGDATPAPDFTMALADGSTFSLSAEEKPVYMVFWAEW